MLSEEEGGPGRDRRARLGPWIFRKLLAGVLRDDRVVPLTMELIAFDASLGALAFSSGEHAPGGVCVLVQHGLDGQSGAGAGGRDGLQQYLVAGQRLPAQAVGDPGEQTMFHLVPF